MDEEQSRIFVIKEKKYTSDEMTIGTNYQRSSRKRWKKTSSNYVCIAKGKEIIRPIVKMCLLPEHQ